MTSTEVCWALSGEQSTNFVYFGFDFLRVRTDGLGCLEVPLAPFPLVLSQCLRWRPAAVPLSGPRGRDGHRSLLFSCGIFSSFLQCEILDAGQH